MMLAKYLIVGFLFTIPLAHAETQTGIASVYTAAEGLTVACPGHRMHDGPPAIAAHKTWPCGTKVKVRNRDNGKTVAVTIIDRGPYVKGRVIDLNRAAARALGCDGLCRVTITRS